MKIVIVGDKSRYQFFRSMLTKDLNLQEEIFTEKLGVRDISLVNNKSENEHSTYVSKRLPLNTSLIFPADSLPLSRDYQKSDRLLVFDEFPYAKESNLRLLEETLASDCFGQVQVVLVKNKRAALESDITNYDMALAKARDCYMEKGIPVTIYEMHSAPEILLWTSNMEKNTGIEKIRQKISQANSESAVFDVSYDLEFMFSEIKDQTDFDILMGFFRYNTKFHDKNIWPYIIDASYNYYFVQNHAADDLCRVLYTNSINDICIWDIEADIDLMKQEVRNEYVQAFVDFKPLMFHGSKLDFEEFINLHQEEIIAFKNTIIDFFSSKMKSLVKTRIVVKIQRMEELLK